ncbi:MAG: DUF4091 domain-containing protein [Clostridia bacterium]|nr:DUF4091 domain-containing protein [Clostridia bacterium]
MIQRILAVIADDDLHTDPADYEKALAEAEKCALMKSCKTTFRRDVALVKADIFTKDTSVTALSAAVSDWKTENGDVIPAASSDIRFVTPTLAHDIDRLIPDCIDAHGPISMDKNSVKTLFVRTEIPADCKAGIYRAILTITADGEEHVLELETEVLPYTLPAVHERGYQLELWMYPFSAERYYSGVKTEDYFGDAPLSLPKIHLTGKADDALRSQLRLYAGAGGKAITTTCVEDPWNTQTHDPYPSMIKWHWHGGADFTFDYTDYDHWIRLNMECGVDGQIKTFSIACWGNRVTYLDDEGNAHTETLTPGSERWCEVWRAFLEDYMRHTTEMGWFDKTYMSMDEREPEDILALLDLNDSVKNADGRSFKTSLAVYRFDAEFLFDRIDDLSLAIYMDAAKVTALAEKRRTEGKLTTLYTCGPSHSALANQPYESEYSQLFCAMRHTDGFLRWALDSFNADPIASSAHRLFAAGDLYMIYPDHLGCGQEAHSSHRFEKIAAGIRDAEKIRTLMAEKPEYADELRALLDSLGQSEDMKAEVHRVMDGVYEIARR